MAINFPDNPFNGQTTTFSGVTYTYNSTKNQWTANNPSTANISSSDNAPTSPSAGDLWFNSANGVMYIYYNDGSSAQWISISGYASSFDSASAISLIDSDYVQSRQTTAASTTIVTDINGLIAISSPSNGDQAYVQSNNNLYFYDSGWYKIATVSNDSPTAITGVSGSYALDISGGTTTITAVSTDPEGFPLTWSYSTTGLGSIATISQSSNVFTITPSTNTANAGSFTLTISVTDGVNGAVSTSSTLTLQFVVTNSKYTTALVTAVDTSDNNNITDASSNNYSITTNGNAYAGTFSPYRHGGYSTYFNNSGNYLTISDDVSLRLDSTDWTIEAWVWWEGDTSDYKILLSKSKKYQLYTQISTGYISFYNLSSELIGTAAPAINGWTHIAITYDYSSTTLKLYKDGINIGTNTSYSIPTSTGDDLTIAQEDSPPNGWDGYIRDLRIVKGTVVYTSNFTPPTEKLEAISGTSLLACSLPYLKDQSTNNHSFTETGSVTIEPFSPYNHQEYSASNHGGSIYFDGSGDYLTIPSLGNSSVTDLTISFWVYPISSAVQPSLYPRFLTIKSPSTNDGFIIYIRDDNTIRFYSNGERIQSSTVRLNEWTHLVLKRNSGTWRLLINGVTQGTYANSTGIDFTSGTMYVGRASSADGYTTGYISDLKIEFSSDNSTSLTPPTSQSSSSGAALHIKGTDASIIDKAQTSNVTLAGNTTGSTSQAKFSNTKSMYFGGSSDYTKSSIIPFGTGDFTVECWLYLNAVSSTGGIFASGNASGGAPGVIVSQDQWWLGNSSSPFDTIVSGGSIFTIGQWQHVAVVRSGSTVTGYVDGSSVGSVSSSRDLTSETIVLAQRYANNFNFASNCYIQDFRATTGLARYTSNFTPPTGELQG